MMEESIFEYTNLEIISISYLSLEFLDRAKIALFR